jgi:hypothetical protein
MFAAQDIFSHRISSHTEAYAFLASRAAAEPGETSSRSPAWPVSGTRTGSGCRSQGAVAMGRRYRSRAHL